MATFARSAKGAGALLVAVSLFAAIPAAPTMALSATACRVTNTDSGVVKKNLAAAVDAASNGDALTVRGVCKGTTLIDKDLTITGIRPQGAAKPVLDGNDLGTVIHVDYGWTVTIKKLAITGGVAESSYNYDGGGIYNDGHVTLAAVDVHHNSAGHDGGGVQNGFGATLTLNGATEIRDNTAGHYGGGVLDGNTGVVTLNGKASIHDNSATSDGGGVYLYSLVTLTLNGSSSIKGNTSGHDGGGIYTIGGTTTLNDTSSIFGNTAAHDGGGIWNDFGADLWIYDTATIHDNAATSGVGGGIYNNYGDLGDGYCATSAIVFDNTPNDCELLAF